MIHVDPIEPNDQNWQQWRKDADEATKHMTSSAEIKAAMYKRGRDTVLDELFHGKCAYCEAPIKADQNSGDVDHFRPKSQVRDRQGNVVFIDTKTPHPGYFWLAYDWMNLLPSCIACNRPHRNVEGENVGKSDRFPLNDESKRVRKRGDDLTQETPLLLNPYDVNLDLTKHLAFSPEVGTVSGLTDEGRETIKILDLNREGLIDERRRRATAAEDAYNAYLVAVQADSPRKVNKREDVKTFESGASPYSAIARVAIARIKEKMLAAILN